MVFSWHHSTVPIATQSMLGGHERSMALHWLTGRSSCGGQRPVSGLAARLAGQLFQPFHSGALGALAIVCQIQKGTCTCPPLLVELVKKGRERYGKPNLTS